MKTRFNLWKYGSLIAVSTGILALDQWTKQLIHTRFRWGESLSVIPNFFSITYVRNKGAAFGLFNAAPPEFREPFFMIVPVLILFMLILFFVFLKEQKRILVVPLTLIISGAIGNLIDRAKHGYVVDFLDFYWKQWHYPAFNVADSAIVVGVSLLLLLEYVGGGIVKGNPSKKGSVRGVL